MGIKLGTKPKRRRASTKQRRLSRRQSYNKKCEEEKFDEFNTDDLIEFYADCYKITYNHYWMPEQASLLNMVFGRLKNWYGPRGALNFIAASFQHRNPPKDAKWYNSDLARDLHNQSYYDHCLAKARDLLDQWYEMHPKPVNGE